MVVVFPAPLCPNNDVIWPLYRFKLKWFTANLPDLYFCKIKVIIILKIHLKHLYLILSYNTYNIYILSKDYWILLL